MANLHIKFDDHTSNRCRVTTKMFQFRLNMNIEGRLCRHSVTSSVTSSAWEIFFMHNVLMVFPFLMSNWSYIEQVTFLKKWRNFEVGANFFVISVTGSFVCYLDSQKHSLHFELWPTFYTLSKKGCYTPGWCVFFVIISISSVPEV